MKFDLGFGNSVCVRDAFLNSINGNLIVFTHDTLSKFDYPAHEGDVELIEMTKSVIGRQTRQKYKHVFLTNGATGAVTIGLRAFHQRGAKYCHTRPAPWYMLYPSMIKASGLLHVANHQYLIRDYDSVVLLDIPSNPLGITRPIDFYVAPTVLDAVYFSKIYTSDTFIPVPAHDIIAGSYSKLTGMNGLRIGWIATNDGLLAERIKDLITGEYCGIDEAGVEILKRCIRDLDWDLFENRAKFNLDCNREEWSKLEKFFEVPVSDIGMFYYSSIDGKCRKLLEKSEIVWTPGSKLGTGDRCGRFNLGQDVMLIRNAVKEILKNDSRKPTKS